MAISCQPYDIKKAPGPSSPQSSKPAGSPPVASNKEQEVASPKVNSCSDDELSEVFPFLTEEDFTDAPQTSTRLHKNKGKGKDKGNRSPAPVSRDISTRQTKSFATMLVEGRDPLQVAGLMFDAAEQPTTNAAVLEDPQGREYLDALAKVTALEQRVETLEAMLDMHLDRLAFFESRLEQLG